MELRVSELVDAVKAGKVDGTDKVLGVQVFDRFDDMLIYDGPAEWIEKTQEGVYIIAHDIGNMSKVDKKQPPALPWKKIEDKVPPPERDKAFFEDDNPFDTEIMAPQVFEEFLASMENDYIVAKLDETTFKIIPASNIDLYSYFLAKVKEPETLSLSTDNARHLNVSVNKLNMSDDVSEVDGETLVLKNKTIKEKV